MAGKKKIEDPKQKRDAPVITNLTASEAAAVKEMAWKQRMSLSDLLRDCILEHILKK